MLIRSDARCRVLVATKGHPWDRSAFGNMWDSFAPDIDWAQVDQPAVMRLLSPEAAADFDVLAFYDIPGIAFRTPEPPLLLDPPAWLRAGWEALLAQGKPMLFLHHAIAGWPTWDEYARTIGARFFYQPGLYCGRRYPDSGYLFPVQLRVEALRSHPVVEGLEAGFEITDELYLIDLLEPDLVPLLRADFSFSDQRFYSAAAALRGHLFSRDGWQHPPGTDLIAWARRYHGAPSVTILLGNDGATFGHPAFRRLVRNAVAWLAGPDAAAWAKAQ